MFLKQLRLLLPLAALGVWAIQLAPGQWSNGKSNGTASSFTAQLTGNHEIPAVSTPATGEFRATLRPTGDVIDYELSWENLSGNPSQAHIHLGQKFANGGIMLWLCKTSQSAPAGTPDCVAATSGKVTGTLSASSVTAITAQQIAAGEWEEALQAIRSGNAYANIHTAISPAGEIRGQLKPGRGVNGGPNDEGSAPKGNGSGNGSAKGPAN